MRPPVQAVGPKVQPNNFRLMGLGVTPALCSALMASTMLFLGSGVGNRAVAGAVSIQVADEGTQALIAREKEEFVLLDWAAYHAAELLQLHWQQRLGRGVEDAAGVPGAVAAKRVSRTVKSVGPRSDSHVHHGTGLPTVLGLRIF